MAKSVCVSTGAAIDFMTSVSVSTGLSQISIFLIIYYSKNYIIIGM